MTLLTPGPIPTPKSSGYVLIFTLWIIVVTSATLGFYLKSSGVQREMPKAMLQQPLSYQEASTLLDYIEASLSDQELLVDARWLNQSQLQSVAQGSAELKQQVDLVIEAFDQLGFTIRDEIIEKFDPMNQQERAARLRQSLDGLGQDVTRADLPASITFANQPYSITLGERLYQIEITPMSAYPNINVLPAETLARYFVVLGMEDAQAQQLSAIIRDWRDEDRTLTPRGAETGYYLSQDPAYEPADKAFQHPAELYFLRSGGLSLLQYLTRHVSLYGDNDKLHISHASPEAITAVCDISLAKANRLLAEIEGSTLDALNLTRVLGIRDRDLVAECLTDQVTDKEVLKIRLFGESIQAEAIYDPARMRFISRRWHF